MTKTSKLPNLCVIKLKHLEHLNTHWVVYHEGVFYDPALGMLEKYNDTIKLMSYLELYHEPVIDYDRLMKMDTVVDSC